MLGKGGCLLRLRAGVSKFERCASRSYRQAMTYEPAQNGTADWSCPRVEHLAGNYGNLTTALSPCQLSRKVTAVTMAHRLYTVHVFICPSTYHTDKRMENYSTYKNQSVLSMCVVPSTRAPVSTPLGAPAGVTGGRSTHRKILFFYLF